MANQDEWTIPKVECVLCKHSDPENLGRRDFDVPNNPQWICHACNDKYEEARYEAYVAAEEAAKFYDAQNE